MVTVSCLACSSEKVAESFGIANGKSGQQLLLCMASVQLSCEKRTIECLSSKFVFQGQTTPAGILARWILIVRRPCRAQRVMIMMIVQ